jgi:uncharacterized protein with PQ loop repeat
MKLQTEDFIATTAVVLGTGQLLVHMVDVYKRDDVSSYSYPSLLIGITGSLLWTVYQIRKGANYSAVYSAAGLIAQLYILQRLIVSHKKKTKSP